LATPSDGWKLDIELTQQKAILLEKGYVGVGRLLARA
jgi:hypothetical protein